MDSPWRLYWCRCPRKEARARSEPSTAWAAARPMNEHAKILVVDDDQRLRDLLLRYLGEQGFAVKVAEGGPAMLAAIGLSRGEKVYIANAVKCRPPNNRTPEAGEMGACMEDLARSSCREASAHLMTMNWRVAPAPQNRVVTARDT